MNPSAAFQPAYSLSLSADYAPALLDQHKIGTMIALFFGVIAVMFWNFLANRYWTYNDVD